MPAYAGEALDDGVPHGVGECLLAAERHRRLGAVRGEDHRCVVVALEPSCRAHLVDDQQVAALARELGPAVGEHVVGSSVSAAKPTTTWPARGRCRPRARPGCRWLRSSSMPGGALAGFLIFELAGSARPEVRDRGGHHDGVGVGGGLEHGVPQLGGRHHRHDLRAGRVGQRHVGGHEHRPPRRGRRPYGQRVALPARRAVAEEAHRVEVLAGAAGADEHLAAGEVRGRCRAASTRAQTAKISSGSGSRPGPVSAPVSRPDAGSRTTTPRERRVATLARVAGCSHISVCIAGANTTGQRAVSRVLVSRSSARPWAALASRSAVAGATTTRSASLPIRTCGTSWTSDQTSVVTGCPDSAAQVAAPTKRSADPVGTTRTAWPLSVSRRSSSAALYAAMPPLTPRTTRGRRQTGDVCPVRRPFRLVDRLGAEQALVDLAERDGQRLLVDVGLDERADVLQQALAELGVVGVDLASALGGVDDEAVLGVGRSSSSSIGGLVMPSGATTMPDTGDLSVETGGRSVRSCAIKATSRSATSWTVVLTSVTSNSPSAASSTRAASSRRSIDLLRLRAAAGEPAYQLVPRRRGQEDQPRLRHRRADLARALQVDLEQYGHSGGEALQHRLARGAVAVAGELGPLEQLALGRPAGRTARG